MISQDVVLAYAAGVSLLAVCGQFKIGKPRARQIIVDAGVQIRTKAEATAPGMAVRPSFRQKQTELAASVVAAYAAGQPCSRISESFGLAKPTIRRLLVEAGVEVRDRSRAMLASPNLPRKSDEHKRTVAKAARARENPDKARARARRYRRGHADKISARRKENWLTISVMKRAWVHANPQKLRAAKARRRALERSAVGIVTEDQWASKLVACGFSCVYCGSSDRITQDHVIPLSRGGHHLIDNLVPACLSCNCSKGNRLLEEWKRAS